MKRDPFIPMSKEVADETLNEADAVLGPGVNAAIGRITARLSASEQGSPEWDSAMKDLLALRDEVVS